MGTIGHWAKKCREPRVTRYLSEKCREVGGYLYTRKEMKGRLTGKMDTVKVTMVGEKGTDETVLTRGEGH